MIVAIQRFFENRRKRQALIQCALAAFRTQYPERRPLENWKLPPQTASDGSTIVCIVWFDGAIPPARTWWRLVGPDSVTELSYAEASRLISIPMWR